MMCLLNAMADVQIFLGWCKYIQNVYILILCVLSFANMRYDCAVESSFSISLYILPSTGCFSVGFTIMIAHCMQM